MATEKLRNRKLRRRDSRLCRRTTLRKRAVPYSHYSDVKNPIISLIVDAKNLIKDRARDDKFRNLLLSIKRMNFNVLFSRI